MTPLVAPKVEQVKPLVYRIGEVARLLQISAASVYRRIDSGAIPAVRYGRSVRVPAWWIEEEGRKGHAA